MNTTHGAKKVSRVGGPAKPISGGEKGPDRVAEMALCQMFPKVFGDVYESHNQILAGAGTKTGGCCEITGHSGSTG